MNITKNLKYFFILPALLSVLAILAIAMWGLRPGIDLAGGSMLQVTYQPTAQVDASVRPPVEQVRAVVEQLNFGEVRIQPVGENGYIFNQRDLSNEEKNQLVAVLTGFGPVHEDQYSSVGPVLGAELLRKGLISLGLVIICIILFIAFAFRHVSKPVASWKYGVVAIVTLLHDILVPAGLFAFLGFYEDARIDSLFIVALLTILGISINDTIVVFDRIRENLRLNMQHSKTEAFDVVVGKSIKQTLARSINTSLTVIIMLAALYFVGPVATKDFALTLIVGMVAGTYSSIFLASPLLVAWDKWSRRNA
ncbi:protein-export membrane protein SecF [Candidatus Adlerbacteria bacterium RIFOXYC1_FULL_48_26]|jgi:preprotein translocase subunit SecF|uniref:Protein-export membrane protein SecF n=1 Tax=Candidatus Adlerbacteria bacterium RIFOXYC1_FULL_48_26 TaxID=1797247 RepID=A0A1F4Y6Q8_9BACT|nr:MAG: protein-export membrane protein SecF [Candidatus Adlerbacteria bacterium RIFOXYC1_FULL_48_26]